MVKDVPISDWHRILLSNEIKCIKTNGWLADCVHAHPLYDYLMFCFTDESTYVLRKYEGLNAAYFKLYEIVGDFNFSYEPCDFDVDEDDSKILVDVSAYFFDVESDKMILSLKLYSRGFPVSFDGGVKKISGVQLSTNADKNYFLDSTDIYGIRFYDTLDISAYKWHWT